MEQGPDVLLRGVSKTFGGTHALQGVDLALRSGEIHGLLGQNGAGKSTLIKIMGGAISADEGSVRIQGESVELNSPADAAAAGIAIVHQDLHLFPELTVAENVAIQDPAVRRFGPFVMRNREADRVRATEHLATLGIDLDVEVPAGDLRPPQRKLLEVARALATHDVRVLVLDEPTAALEPKEADQLFELLGRLRAQGVAIVLVSHKLDEVFRVCDAVTVLRDGNVVAEARTDALEMGDLVGLVAGRELTRLVASDRRPGSPLLAAEDLSVGDVGPADFELCASEVVALTGLLGSGSDEFGRVLAAARTQRSGRVHVDGGEVPAGNRAVATNLGLGFIPEDRAEAVVPNLSIQANIALASIGRVTQRGRISRTAMREQAERFIELLDIRPADPEMPLGQLSGGNQQKVILARWLASESRVLVLEEPTHGLDVGAKSEIHALLQSFAEDGGAVLMVSSELAEIVQLSDRIGVFRHGELVAELPRGVSEHEVATSSVRAPSVGKS